MNSLFEQLLEKRGLTGKNLETFLNPNYELIPDPFRLTDMAAAVKRIKAAQREQEKILIYGDYDVDGITATVLLYSALQSFSFKRVNYLLPHRKDGYGLSDRAVEQIAQAKPNLLITVDCGSSDNDQIKKLTEAGIDVIVTDHHQLRNEVPEALAVINPNRPGDKYPFKQLPGVGVAFKLVQALQTQIDGLPLGQEKWLLDLVAIGTVCDGMPLLDENRVNTYFGLKVLNKTHRPGLKALVEVSGNKKQLTSTDLGFRLGPRLNAAGRLTNANQALDLLLELDKQEAIEKALSLNRLNDQRKSAQLEIISSIDSKIIDKYSPVLVAVGDNYHEGIIGIIASKLVEKYKKPAFVFTKTADNTLKGSARSFGDFSLAEALKQCQPYIVTGGGHREAAGVTLQYDKINDFCKAINNYYISLNLPDQSKLLDVSADVEIKDLSVLNTDLMRDLAKLEPYGNGNPEPIFRLVGVSVIEESWLGADSNHLRLTVSDSSGNDLKLMSFYESASHKGKLLSKKIGALITLGLNEWNGYTSVEGQICKILDSN